MESNAETKTPEQKVDVAKQVLFEQFCQQYQALSQLINRIPVPQGVKSIVVTNFDTGFLWMKEAFNLVSFEPPKLTTVPAVAPCDPLPVDAPKAE